MPDKYLATWVSHSSIGDFLKCPRAYYLKNVYKDPKTNRKIQLMAPPLALGQTVHSVLEALSVLPVEKRFDQPLMRNFEKTWQKVAGKQGGFNSEGQEKHYFERGRAMIERVAKNPGPLERLAVKIKADLPQFWLSEADEIMLCGKLDWLEYIKETNSVVIIDFKTGKRPESDGSLQLPIYYLLARETQERAVSGVSYWYLERENAPQAQELPQADRAKAEIMQIAKKIKLAKKLNHFTCPEGEAGCRYCAPFEKILRGEAEYIGVGGYGNDTYVLLDLPEDQIESEIL